MLLLDVPLPGDSSIRLAEKASSCSEESIALDASLVPLEASVVDGGSREKSRCWSIFFSAFFDTRKSPSVISSRSMSSSSNTLEYCSLRIRDSATMNCINRSKRSASLSAAASRATKLRCRSFARAAKAVGLSGSMRSETGLCKAFVEGVSGICMVSSVMGI